MTVPKLSVRGRERKKESKGVNYDKEGDNESERPTGSTQCCTLAHPLKGLIWTNHAFKEKVSTISLVYSLAHKLIGAYKSRRGGEERDTLSWEMRKRKHDVPIPTSPSGVDVFGYRLIVVPWKRVSGRESESVSQ